MMTSYLDKFSKYDKLTKTQAKKVLENGGIIIICPCKCNPRSQFSITINQNEINLNYGSFENFLNHFAFYNLNYSELGKKPAFYIL